MSDITMEQKLRLVQQVRSRYHEDQYDLSSRERILYGKTGHSSIYEGTYKNPYRDTYANAYENNYGKNGIPEDTPFSFFRLRLVLAVILLALVILMDKNSINVAGISTEKIFGMISADYENKIEEWVEAISGRTDTHMRSESFPDAFQQ